MSDILNTGGSIVLGMNHILTKLASGDTMRLYDFINTKYSNDKYLIDFLSPESSIGGYRKEIIGDSWWFTPRTSININNVWYDVQYLILSPSGIPITTEETSFERLDKDQSGFLVRISLNKQLPIVDGMGIDFIIDLDKVLFNVSSAKNITFNEEGESILGDDDIAIDIEPMELFNGEYSQFQIENITNMINLKTLYREYYREYHKYSLGI